MKSISHAKSAKAATNNHFPSFPSSRNQISNTKNQKSLPSLPWRPLRESIPTPHPAAAGSATFAKDFSDQQNSPSRPWRPLREQTAFSLTEVVIAMGVAAVAFTSIIALFPLGLNMSKESYEATQAALIAQTILADLLDEGAGSGTLGSSRFIQIGGNSDPTSSANYLTINFETASTITVYLAYNQIRRTNNDTDSSGQPIMLRPCAGVAGTVPAWYSSGSNGLSMLVKVTVTPCFRVNGAGASGGPKRVDVSVESPGDASATNRSQFLFTGGTPPS